MVPKHLLLCLSQRTGTVTLPQYDGSALRYSSSSHRKPFIGSHSGPLHPEKNQPLTESLASTSTSCIMSSKPFNARTRTVRCAHGQTELTYNTYRPPSAANSLDGIVVRKVNPSLLTAHKELLLSRFGD
jgi:hypothetical protein